MWFESHEVHLFLVLSHTISAEMGEIVEALVLEYDFSGTRTRTRTREVSTRTLE